MTRDDLLRLAQNPNLIPGIYIYCDRWCERCPFTQRCMNFALEQAQTKALGSMDQNRDKFWTRFGNSLHATSELLSALANEHGLNVNAGDLPPSTTRDFPHEQNELPPPLVQAAHDYARLVDEWFKAGEGALRVKEEEVLAQAQLGVAGLNEEVATLTDVVEILRWYQHQIDAKLFAGVERCNQSPEASLLDSEGDSGGLIKVALIGIDRSIAAWLRMKEFFPEKTDSILTLLVHLDRLRRAAEKEFPGARSFVRPGFDTGAAAPANPQPDDHNGV